MKGVSDHLVKNKYQPLENGRPNEETKRRLISDGKLQWLKSISAVADI